MLRLLIAALALVLALLSGCNLNDVDPDLGPEVVIGTSSEAKPTPTLEPTAGASPVTRLPAPPAGVDDDDDDDDDFDDDDDDDD